VSATVPVRTIVVEFDINPATAYTCGDGSGDFCRYCRWSVLGGANCDLFGTIEVVNDWLQRRP